VTISMHSAFSMDLKHIQTGRADIVISVGIHVIVGFVSESSISNCFFTCAPNRPIPKDDKYTVKSASAFPTPSISQHRIVRPCVETDTEFC
jgi:hypothetical protein